jgi:hemoglobin
MSIFKPSILILALACSLAAPAFAQQAPTTPSPTTTPPPASSDDLQVEDAAPDTVDVPDATAPETTSPDATTARDSSAMNPAPADPSLLPVFKDFGEVPGLTALMDDFMVLLLADPRISPFFENADQKAIKRHLVEQFCVILGGPCSYTGRDMKTVHAGLEIDRANFNALVEDLQKAMAKRGIPFRSQNKLLAKLAPMHREIETR